LIDHPFIRQTLQDITTAHINNSNKPTHIHDISQDARRTPSHKTTNRKNCTSTCIPPLPSPYASSPRAAEEATKKRNAKQKPLQSKRSESYRSIISFIPLFVRVVLAYLQSGHSLF